MRIAIALPQGLSLEMDDSGPGPGRYATSHLQRGWMLLDQGAPLAEEAVGFGVPVLKKGLQTIFPGAVHIDQRQDGPNHFIRARFILDRVERFASLADRSVGNPAFYAVKDLLAATIRRMPASRRPLTWLSSKLRQLFGWHTAYHHAGFETVVTVDYRLDAAAGSLGVELDCTDLSQDITEVVLMHEQGAHAFDLYRDTAGLVLRGDQIGCWDPVAADRASFESSTHKLSFELGQSQGATLFRGRELIGSRLAWAGFGYSFPPALGRLSHEIVIKRLA